MRRVALIWCVGSPVERIWIILQACVVVLVCQNFKHISRTNHGSNTMEALLDVGVSTVHKSIDRHRHPVVGIFAEHAVIQAGVVNEIEVLGLEVVVWWCNEGLILELSHRSCRNVSEVVNRVRL